MTFGDPVFKNPGKHYSLIFPYTHYGIVPWRQAAETHMNKILLLQKRVLRLIYGMEYRVHTIPLFISANILPVNMLYHKNLAAQMHDVSSGIAPSKISNLFTQPQEIHTYNTRISNA